MPMPRGKGQPFSLSQFALGPLRARADRGLGQGPGGQVPDLGPGPLYLEGPVSGNRQPEPGPKSWPSRNVPRGTIFVEWGGFDAASRKWLVLLGFDLRTFMGFCALMQRMGIFACFAAWNNPAAGAFVAFERLRRVLGSPHLRIEIWGTRISCLFISGPPVCQPTRGIR
jgi:hypothetical protein